MSIHPIDSFLEAVEKSGLAPDTNWEQLKAELQGQDTEFITQNQVAEVLVQRDFLTEYQAEQVLQGRGDECILAGRYHLLEKVGSGGMGNVFRAKDTQLDRVVAIKLMMPHHMDSPDAVERFKREAKALAALALPNVVKAFDSGEDKGRNFLVMEYVQGVSLDKLVKQKGKVPPSVAADYAYRVALGMYRAHLRGMIHRDLKPSNLLLSPDGEIKILDLGLARFVHDFIGDSTITRDQTSLGTPDYMPPEQFQDAKRVDQRADVYALGCTLYQLIAGQVPFPGSSFSEKLQAHESKQPQPLQELTPEVPVGLTHVIGKMMAKRPVDRYQDMREVAEALAAHVAGSSPSLPSAQQTVSFQAQQQSQPAKRRWAIFRFVAMLAVFLLGCLGTYGLYTWSGIRGPKDSNSVANAGEKKDAERKTNELSSKKRGWKKPKQTPKPVVNPPKPKSKVITIPNGWTVAKDGTGQCKTITEALERCQAGQVIRILDAGVYEEPIRFLTRTRHTGVTLESVNGATLKAPPGTKNLIEIADVGKVHLRGLRLRSANPNLATFIWLHGRSGGAILEECEIDGTSTSMARGIEIHGVTMPQLGDPRIIFRRNRFQNLAGGIVLAACPSHNKESYQTPVPLKRVLIQDNSLVRCNWGIIIRGAASQIQVVGNRIFQSSQTAMQLENLLEGAEHLLIANNTILENSRALTIRDTSVRGKSVVVANNLFLDNAGTKILFVDSGGDPVQGKSSKEFEGLFTSSAWSFLGNWYQVNTAKSPYKDWKPPGGTDKVSKTIEVESRTPGAEGFLRPKADSPLATEGAGKTNPAFPKWVGAVPPKGAKPWNWKWTWDAHFEKTLTVSKDSKHNAQFHTIGAALAKVRPNVTIRVLDKGVYQESLALNQKDQHSGITLEAVDGAVLDGPGVLGIHLFNVRNVTLRGFTVRSKKAAALIFVQGVCPGVLLENLRVQGEKRGINIEAANLSRDDPPIEIRNCQIAMSWIGIRLSGYDSDGKKPLPSRRILIRSNKIKGSQFGCLLLGEMTQCGVVGNQFLGCSSAAIRVEAICPNSRDLFITNNTIVSCERALELHDTIAGRTEAKPQFSIANGKNFQVRNNLVLSCGKADMTYVVGKVSLPTPKAARDGKQVYKHWAFSHNWRESKKPTGTTYYDKGWIPPNPDTESGEVLRPLIAGLARTPGPKFLQPPAKSDLATKGAGTKDKYLPKYIGAVPPPKVEAWDWDVTWRALQAKKK